MYTIHIVVSQLQYKEWLTMVVATTIVSRSLFYNCETTTRKVYMSCTQCELRLKSLRQEYVRQVKCG